MTTTQPVVLAGGNGVRLWPLSRASQPKPFLPLLPEGVSPFQAALRAAGQWGDPLVIGRHAHRFLAAEQIRATGLEASLVLEPDPRGGGAALGLAAFLAAADAHLLVLPSEAPGDLGSVQPDATWQVGRDGERVVWDLVPAQAVRDAIAELMGPSAARVLQQAAQTHPDLSFRRVLPGIWAEVPHLDAELLRRSAGARTVQAAAGAQQSDWAAVHAAGTGDDQRNVLVGDAKAIGSTGCLVHANERLVTVLDVHDLAVIETADAVLVAPLQAADRVRDLVSHLDTLDRPEARTPRRVPRPWGAFEAIGEGPRWKAKRIVVQPGQALSLQRHAHRAEHWVVVRGRARIQRGDEVVHLGVDASTYIPRGTLHRLENDGDEPLVIVEVQTGDRLAEDDIERVEDRYGRTGLD